MAQQKTAKVKAKLLSEISSSNIGDQVTPELKLAEELGVSQVTVRRAISQLVEEGYLQRIQGSGTFVRRFPMENGSEKLSLESLFHSHPGHHQPTLETASEYTSLRFSLFDDPSLLLLYEKIIKGFREYFPKTAVSLDFQKFRQEMSTPEYFFDMNKGVFPDIFALQRHHLFWLIKNNYIQPLDNFLADEPGYPLDTLDKFVRDAVTYKGKIWMLPKNMHIFYLCYNKKLFDKEGIPYPDETWTWETYLEAAKALTKPAGKSGTGEQFGSVPFRSLNYITPLLWAHGANLVDESGKVKLTSSETIDTIHFAADLVLKHGVTPSPETFYSEHPSDLPKMQPKILFKKSKLGMFLMASMHYVNHFSTIKDLDWDIAVIPRGPAGRFTQVSFSGWSVSSATDSPRMAGELAKYLAGTNGASHFVASGNEIPAINTGEILRLFLDRKNKQNLATILAMKNYLREYPFKGHFLPFVTGDIFRMFREIYLKRKSLKDVVIKTQRRMQRAMDEFLRWDNS